MLSVLNNINIEVSPDNINTEMCPDNRNTEVCPDNINTEMCPDNRNTEVCPASRNAEMCPDNINTEVCPRKSIWIWKKVEESKKSVYLSVVNIALHVSLKRSFIYIYAEWQKTTESC